MFPSSFKQDGFNGEITRYEQTPIITASRSVDVPPGCKRVEALLCGGGGGGFNSTQQCGGGFGGLQIFVIPQTGKPLEIVIGAGGASATRGGTTSVSSGGAMLAATGGGGAGDGDGPISNTASNGLFGGCGGGTTAIGSRAAGSGGSPHPNQPIWSALDAAPAFTAGNNTATNAFLPPGSGSNNTICGQKGLLGGGSGGGSSSAYAGRAGPGGGSGDTNTTDATYGGGGSESCRGGGLTAVSVWGLTGFAASATNGHGGGGMLAASTDKHGGNGGGGGGSQGAGTGGNGFAVLRFYF